MPDDPFNVVPAPNYGAPLLNFGGQQATKQPASTGAQATQPSGQLSPTDVQRFTRTIGGALLDLQRQMQRYGVGQQQPQAPPATWNLTPQQAQPQQQVGPPMNILPPGYGQ